MFASFADSRHLPQWFRDESNHDGQSPPGVPVWLLREPNRAGCGGRSGAGYRAIAVQPEQVLKFNPKYKTSKQTLQKTIQTITTTIIIFTKHYPLSSLPFIYI